MLREERKREGIYVDDFRTKRKAKITINAPLILKMRNIIFFVGKLHKGPFQGIF
jgi:hypothetical protein